MNTKITKQNASSIVEAAISALDGYSQTLAALGFSFSSNADIQKILHKAMIMQSNNQINN